MISTSQNFLLISTLLKDALCVDDTAIKECGKVDGTDLRGGTEVLGKNTLKFHFILSTKNPT
jgi:hypothetical protein